jgi:probable rRNA maturation factor
MKAEKLIGQVDVILVDDKEIRRLHRKWFKKDSTTDVITFPIEPEPPILGEVYISVDTARRQAVEYGATLTNELCRLAVHGTLHLAGHTDHTPEQRERMHNLENQYIVSR